MTDAHVLAILWLIETVVGYSLGAIVLITVSAGTYSAWRDRPGKEGGRGSLGRPAEA